MTETMKTNISGAIRITLKEEMQRDGRVFLMGEDIAEPNGGVQKCTKGLSTLFGTDRVINTPLSEIAIVGCGVGAAVAGMRPVVEVMFSDFLLIGMDHIINNAAKIHFLTGGKETVPIVIRSMYGIGAGHGAHHSQIPFSWFMNVPGLKMVAPATPRDAQGLLKAAIADPNPVLFFEAKSLYATTGEVLVQNEAIPIGQGLVRKDGTDVTLVTYGICVHRALEAAERLEKEGLHIEVIDLRSIKPFDKALIAQSIQKTGRLLVVEDDTFEGGIGANIIDYAALHHFSALRRAPVRLATEDVPFIPYKAYESMQVPTAERIAAAARRLMDHA